MPTNFKINGLDFSDVYIPKAPFSEGGLWVWGNNSYGNLGTGDTSNKMSPIQTVAYGTTWKQTSAGRMLQSAIKTDGTLWLWGRNSYGQLGNNSTTNTSSPVQTVSYGTNWKQVAVGMVHAVAIKTDGTLWNWGHNAFGQLGTGDRTHRSSPIQTVAYGTNWKQVACGSYYSAAIKTDGTLWCWGYGDFGQLGGGYAGDVSSPVQTVAYGTNWKQVAAGYYTTAAIKTDGTLWVWGNNAYGLLGVNDRTHRSSPVQTVTYGTNWKQVACNYSTLVAVKTDGTLWGSGGNTYGQLGTNDITHRSSPIQTVAYGTNWKQVAVGFYHTMAIKNDGTLWAWGYNAFGQLGTDGGGSKSSPVQTIAYGTNWKQISADEYSCGALKDDGLIY